MPLTIADSKIKKQNLVLINNDAYQRETLSKQPIQQPLIPYEIKGLSHVPCQFQNPNAVSYFTYYLLNRAYVLIFSNELKLPFMLVYEVRITSVFDSRWAFQKISKFLGIFSLTFFKKKKFRVWKCFENLMLVGDMSQTFIFSGLTYIYITWPISSCSHCAVTGQWRRGDCSFIYQWH